MLPVIGPVRPWADPSVTQLGREPMHVPLHGFTRRSLDGNWSLEMFDTPDEVPPAALKGDVSRRGRSIAVAVPGNWTMQDLGGFVDLPQYTNVQMPFPGPPPALPERNPTGVYRRTFDVPAGWMKGRVVLHLGGAESVHAVYINGEFAGYGTDSRLPSEYDVTELVERGANEVAIVVVKFSAHSYVEDQDQWWMGGLHRSVWVESRPTNHLADVPVDVGFDPTTGRGRVAVRPRVSFAAGAQPNWTIRAELTDPAGKQVGKIQQHTIPHGFDVPYIFEGHTVTAEWEFGRAKPWSAERPDRYTVTIELLDPKGKVRQTEQQLVGVRSVEVRDRQLLVNGESVWIFGVNRHDHHPDRGKAVNEHDMRADLEQMRRHNISAVRTAHYPNDSAFYDLCDELGFMVIDESNIESHAYNTSLCHDPAYRSAWLERGSRMVQRDRNHPSVIVWSLGNESGYGAHHDALAGWIRNADPSRPLHYEGAVFHAGWVDGGLPASDLVCPMYPTIDAIREYGENGDGDRPLIMCEYSHAMGNSNGSLADYWDVIINTPGLQGGFLWEWKDHGLRQTLPDGTVRLAYGGQFGEDPHDGNFVADGLVSADLEPHPAMHEVAWCHRPVTVEAARSGRVDGLLVTNRRSFTDLADLRATWELQVDGAVVKRGALKVPKLDGGTSAWIPLPAAAPGEGDVRLHVRWGQRTDSWFAPAGHLVAWDEVEVRPSTEAVARGPQGSDDIAKLVSAPEPCIFRAPIDNDGFKLMPELSRRIRVGGTSLVAWQDAGIDHGPATDHVDHSVDVEHTDAGIAYAHTIDVPESLSDLGRVGVTLRVPARFDRMRWLGRGPHENYPDRNRSAMLGEWESGLDDSPYLVPQEFGLRTDCRWLELIDSTSGDRIRFDEFSMPLHISATRYEVAELYRAPTATELEPADHVVVQLDVAHRGLGTASCGPDILEQYRVATGEHRFSYRVSTASGD